MGIVKFLIADERLSLRGFMLRMQRPLLLVSAWLVLATGCDAMKQDRRAYEAIWRSSSQANPRVRVVAPDDPDNLLASGKFRSNGVLMVQGAITDVLKSEMKSYGVAPNLDGLIATLTRPLKPPDATTDGEISRSRWMLAVRNFFWSTSPDKSAEVHSDNSGNLLLVLMDGSDSIRRCYVDESGGVAEYVLRNEE